MKEILDIPVETEEIQHIQESGLSFENLIHLLDSDIQKTPSDEQIKSLVNPSEDVVIDFTKELELIFEESKKESSKSSSESSQPSSKIAKLDTPSPFSSQEDDLFEVGDIPFITSTQQAIDDVNNLFNLPKPEEKNVQFANPWKSNGDTSKNQPVVPPSTKSSLQENFKKAWGSKGSSSSEAQKPAQTLKTVPAYTNPWSKAPAKLDNKMPPEVDREKPKPMALPWSKQPEVAEKKTPFSNFMTAGQLAKQEKEKITRQKGLTKNNCPSALTQRKSNSQDRNEDPLRKKFQIPIKSAITEQIKSKGSCGDDELNHELLKGFDRNLLMRIKREVVCHSEKLSWDDIAGLDKAKEAIFESVIYPVRQPELYQGLRRGSRAILLFGSPGNGKTLIGKAISSEVDATFLSISASSLTSKWIGESENLVRAMFAYAVVVQPSVIFFDEIDSLLMKRDGGGESGGETMIRLKTEFLVQLDGTNSLKDSDQVILIGATNRPDSIDEAVRRRFTKRILIPLPNHLARLQLMKNLLHKNKENHSLTENDFEELSGICTNGIIPHDL